MMRGVCVAVFAALVAISAAAQSSDMFVFKSAPATATTGSNITFTVTVGNGGPDDAPNAHFDDVLPADATFVSVSQTTGLGFGCTTPTVGSTGTVTCSIATLPASSTAQFDIVVNVAAKAAGTTLINTVTAASGNPDDNPENDTSTTGTNVAGGNSADVSILKTGPNSQPADTDITYTITVTNFGPNDATNVSWTDTLPNSIPPSSPLTFVSFTQNSGPAFNCGVPGSTTTCTIAAFPAGSTATFTLVAHIPSGTTSGHTYTNVASDTATASSSSADTNPSNNSATANTTINAQADVSIVKTGPATAVNGNNVTYTITVANAGPSTAANVTMVEGNPPGMTFVSES